MLTLLVLMTGLADNAPHLCSMKAIARHESFDRWMRVTNCAIFEPGHRQPIWRLGERLCFTSGISAADAPVTAPPIAPETADAAAELAGSVGKPTKLFYPSLDTPPSGIFSFGAAGGTCP